MSAQRGCKQPPARWPQAEASRRRSVGMENPAGASSRAPRAPGAPPSTADALTRAARATTPGPRRLTVPPPRPLLHEPAQERVLATVKGKERGTPVTPALASPGASRASSQGRFFINARCGAALQRDKTPFVTTGSFQSLLRLPKTNTTASQRERGRAPEPRQEQGMLPADAGGGGDLAAPIPPGSQILQQGWLTLERVTNFSSHVPSPWDELARLRHAWRWHNSLIHNSGFLPLSQRPGPPRQSQIHFGFLTNPHDLEILSWAFSACPVQGSSSPGLAWKLHGWVVGPGFARPCRGFLHRFPASCLLNTRESLTRERRGFCSRTVCIKGNGSCSNVTPCPILQTREEGTFREYGTPRVRAEAGANPPGSSAAPGTIRNASVCARGGELRRSFAAGQHVCSSWMGREPHRQPAHLKLRVPTPQLRKIFLFLPLSRPAWPRSQDPA